jgi:hypothetical protein
MVRSVRGDAGTREGECGVKTKSRPYKYSAKYDAYYHAVTGKWREAKCEDPMCIYCPKRPAKYTPKKRANK